MNLVVLPLAGVSQTLFWQYREFMPSLWRLFDHSISFSKFYCASTSAFQSFCDFLYGDSVGLDHNLTYPTAPGCLLGQSENLFEILAREGYSTLGILHGEMCPPYLRDNCLGAWPTACGEFFWYGEYDPFFAKCQAFIEKSADAGIPFALYCGDQVGTVADNSPEKRGSVLFNNRFAKGFSLMDDTIERIFRLLEANSLLENTLIVLYGPYGMDPWKHSISSGKTRGMEPYADMCWTPLFFYCKGQGGPAVPVLASSVDLKATILGMMFPEREFGAIASLFSGVDLQKTRRNVAFTQNLFALERENEGPAKGLIKSYAVSDGDQRLIVSSDGGIAGDGGMELFYDPRDPGNTRNLLDFFELNQNGDMISFGREDIIHPHFTQSFKPNLVLSIIESYNAMRDILKNLIQIKEEEALKHCAEKSQSLLFHHSHFKIKRQKH